MCWRTPESASAGAHEPVLRRQDPARLWHSGCTAASSDSSRLPLSSTIVAALHIPFVVADPAAHTMGQRLRRYVASRVHHAIDSEQYRSIRVIGSYDRSAQASETEKRGKRENWQRPTASRRADELMIHCFPGLDYVFHYGSLIATHLGLTGRDPGIVELVPPTFADCLAQIRCGGFDRLDRSELVIVGAGLETVYPGAQWRDLGTFYASRERDRSVTWLIVKHSFWGDIARALLLHLHELGFHKFIFIGKLGSLRPGHVPNETLATGSSSNVEGTIISWSNLVETVTAANLYRGHHVTLPSVLQETCTWRESLPADCCFVDPEIGRFAQAAQETGAGFGYLHLVSDNVAASYAEDLSNERELGIPDKRKELYRNIAHLLEAVLAAP